MKNKTASFGIKNPYFDIDCIYKMCYNTTIGL